MSNSLNGRSFLFPSFYPLVVDIIRATWIHAVNSNTEVWNALNQQSLTKALENKNRAKSYLQSSLAVLCLAVTVVRETTSLTCKLSLCECPGRLTIRWIARYFNPFCRCVRWIRFVKTKIPVLNCPRRYDVSTTNELNCCLFHYCPPWSTLSNSNCDAQSRRVLRKSYC